MSATNITVNGEALDAVLDREHRAEIQDLRKSEESVKLHRHIASKPRMRSGARTSPGEVVYVKGQKETHIIVYGIVFPWHIKAPYVPSGMSVFGAIEYNDESGEMKCHECGNWYRDLALHSRSGHSVSPKEYRQRHGFRLTARLKSPAIPKVCPSPSAVANSHGMLTKEDREKGQTARRARTSFQAQSPELANLRMICRAQLERRIKDLAGDLSRTPTLDELRSSGLMPATLKRRFGVPVREILRSLNLTPRVRGQKCAAVA